MWHSRTLLMLLAAAAAAPSPPTMGAGPRAADGSQQQQRPMLFMLPTDLAEPWGLQYPVATPVANLSANLSHGANTNSDPFIAAFDRPDGSFELVQHAQTSPNLMWSTVVSDLETSGREQLGKANRTFFLPQKIPSTCHIKDLAKDPTNSTEYLLALFCEGEPRGHNGVVMLKGDIHSAASFCFDPHGRTNLTAPNFYDHDDVHLIHHGHEWLDYQISFQEWNTAGFRPQHVICNATADRYTCKHSPIGGVCASDPTGEFEDKVACMASQCMPDAPPSNSNHTGPCNTTMQSLKYCDNAGCQVRRVVTMRRSADGYTWGPDASCPGREEHSCGDVASCPSGYDPNGMIVPDPVDDPPELEFYFIKPFRIGGEGADGRLAAHALLYAPSPQEALGAGYGLTGHHEKGPACTKPNIYNLTQCHGPHMYTERWVSASNDPSNLTAWSRPFKRQRVLPPQLLDRELSVGPITWRGHHTWLVTQQGEQPTKPRFELWGVPLLRLAGMYAPANAEFTTPSFLFSPGETVWLNAAARWSRISADDACDEGCQSYIMVEMRDADGQDVIHGRSRDGCVLLDVDGQKLPLRWSGDTQRNSDSKGSRSNGQAERVTLRIFYRDATIFAAGVDTARH